MTRVRGYAPYRSQKQNRELVENAILKYTDPEQYEAALEWQDEIRRAA